MLILFGMTVKGIGGSVFIAHVGAVLVRVLAKALAIYPSRTAAGVDSLSG
jgi:hypothetical protein